MMKIVLWTTATLAVVALVYALWLRPLLLRHRVEGNLIDRFFDWIEPIELALWLKSETILKARAMMVVGAVLTFATNLGTLDITPLVPLVPERFQGIVTTLFAMIPLTITVLGWMDEKLRRETTKPIALVAIPDKDVPVAVADAVQQAELAKKEAVATVAVAQSAGAV